MKNDINLSVGCLYSVCHRKLLRILLRHFIPKIFNPHNCLKYIMLPPSAHLLPTPPFIYPNIPPLLTPNTTPLLIPTQPHYLCPNTTSLLIPQTLPHYLSPNITPLLTPNTTSILTPNTTPLPSFSHFPFITIISLPIQKYIP